MMTLLRTGDFRQEDAVAEGFMRSNVALENDDPLRFAQHLFGSGFFTGAVLSVASVGIEDEDGTVFAADLDRLAGAGVLVEQVAAWLRIVVWNPFPDACHGGSMGSKV